MRPVQIPNISHDIFIIIAAVAVAVAYVWASFAASSHNFSSTAISFWRSFECRVTNWTNFQCNIDDSIWYDAET